MATSRTCILHHTFGCFIIYQAHDFTWRISWIFHGENDIMTNSAIDLLVCSDLPRLDQFGKKHPAGHLDFLHRRRLSIRVSFVCTAASLTASTPAYFHSAMSACTAVAIRSSWFHMCTAWTAMLSPNFCAPCSESMAAYFGTAVHDSRGLHGPIHVLFSCSKRPPTTFAPASFE